MVGASDILDIFAKSRDITDKETEGHGREGEKNEVTAEDGGVDKGCASWHMAALQTYGGVFMTLCVLQDVTCMRSERVCHKRSHQSE